MKKNKKLGFTLAEVLITLTIIGIIAAMTVPTLISKYQKQTYVVGLKRVYAQLQHAVKMIPITEGCSAGDFDCAGALQSYSNTDKEKTLYLLSKNLKTRKYCFFYNKTLEGKNLYAGEKECKDLLITDNIYEGAIQLEDSTIITMHGYVDINGPKGPNKAGRDRFHFPDIATIEDTENVQRGTITPQGSFIYYKHFGSSYWKFGKYCTSENVNNQSNLAYLCTGRVLEEGAMNY